MRSSSVCFWLGSVGCAVSGFILLLFPSSFVLLSFLFIFPHPYVPPRRYTPHFEQSARIRMKQIRAVYPFSHSCLRSAVIGL